MYAVDLVNATQPVGASSSIPDWVSLSTGVILASAALLAFVVQRQKYFKDIEPHLELDWEGGVKIDGLDSKLTDPWSFTIALIASNESMNHAYNLSYEAKLCIVHDRKGDRSASTDATFQRRLNRRIYGKSKATLPVVFSYALAKELHTKATKDVLDRLVPHEVDFRAVVTVKYTSEQQVALYALSPWLIVSDALRLMLMLIQSIVRRAKSLVSSKSSKAEGSPTTKDIKRLWMSLIAGRTRQYARMPRAFLWHLAQAPEAGYTPHLSGPEDDVDVVE